MIKREGLHPCWQCDGEGKTPSSEYVEWCNPTEKYREHFDKHHPLQVCNACSGEGELFYEDEEEYFNKLADRFDRDTMHYSFLCMDHPCYITMKKMGKKAIPYLLNRMRKEMTWLMGLFYEWIKEADRPNIPEEAKGRIKKLTKIWTEWGKEKGYIE